MAERISALHGYTPHPIAGKHEVTVVLREVHNLRLHQISAWPDTAQQIEEKSAQAIGMDPVRPAPLERVAKIGTNGALLPIAPLKWWLLDSSPPTLTPAQGAILNLSHALTHVRISGLEATHLLNRHLPLDLRPHSFPVGTIASSALHHVGVTVWHSQLGYELFIPRSFALSLWEMLVQTATQFGVEIIQ